MKIISTSEMRRVETLAIQQGLSAAEMMGNAAAGIARIVVREISQISGEVLILGLAGKGNNGGDCLLTLEMLAKLGYQAAGLTFGRENPNDTSHGQAQSGGVERIEATPGTIDGWFSQHTDEKIIFVDGLLGTGFSGKLSVAASQVLKRIRENLANCATMVVAVDCPSGINCDSGEVSEETLRADITVCLAACKAGLLKEPALAFTGQLELVEIGLDAVMQDWLAALDDVITPRVIANLIPYRSPFSHKGSFGKVLVAGGCQKYAGALSLCLQAALRVGVGLVTGACSEQVMNRLTAALPDVTWQPLAGNTAGQLNQQAARSLLDQAGTYSAMAIGPGLGVSEDTNGFMKQFITSCASETGIPLVFDADGLKCLAEIPEWCRHLSREVVLTPHPGEMALLTGLPIREIQADRIEICRKFANLWQKVVVLKGSGTVVSTPDGKVWVSPVATSALAHAGSGDVLTGIIAGYLAQGLSAREAAVLGVGLHAKCAQVAVNEPGCEDSVLASDLVRCIPAAIAQLREIKSR